MNEQLYKDQKVLKTAKKFSNDNEDDRSQSKKNSEKIRNSEIESVAESRLSRRTQNSIKKRTGEFKVKRIGRKKEEKRGKSFKVMKF